MNDSSYAADYKGCLNCANFTHHPDDAPPVTIRPRLYYRGSCSVRGGLEYSVITTVERPDLPDCATWVGLPQGG